MKDSKLNGVNKQVSVQKQSGPSAGLGWLVPLLIFLLTVVAFLPLLQNDFVNWDDDRNLLENPYYRGLGWPELRWMFSTFHMSLYRPLTWVTFGLDYLVWGMNPFGYHLTSLLLHAVNATLFYFVSLQLLRLAMPRPAVSGEFSFTVAAGSAALFFSLHPLRVEPVAWASARNDVLSGLFFLCAILCYLRATTLAETEALRWRWMTIAVVTYGMSLLSKAIGMTLPVVLLALDIYPLRRLGGGQGSWFGSAVRRVWWEKVPFLILALGAGVTALIAKERAIYSFDELSALPRVAQALYGLSFYLWKTVMPFGLSPLYQLPIHFDPWDWPFVASGLVVVVVSIVLFIARHHWPAGLASWVCYVILLAPVLGIAQSGPQIVADRYTYLSCLGWAVVTGAGLLYCWRFWVSGRIGYQTFILAIGLAVITLIGTGVLTWQQTQVWQNSERLWRHAVDVDQKSRYVHNSLGNALFERGDLEEAIDHFRQALQLNPAYAKAHNNLGNALFERGDLEEAIDHFRQALRIDPGYVKAHYNLGVALARRGELEDAIDHFYQALRLDPAYAKAHYNLGVALARRGELEGAIDHFRQALRTQPQYAEAHESLGRALAQEGKRDEAVQHYQEALRILKSRPKPTASQ